MENKNHCSTFVSHYATLVRAGSLTDSVMEYIPRDESDCAKRCLNYFFGSKTLVFFQDVPKFANFVARIFAPISAGFDLLMKTGKKILNPVH